jgi:hypothetical protein
VLIGARLAHETVLRIRSLKRFPSLGNIMAVHWYCDLHHISGVGNGSPVQCRVAGLAKTVKEILFGFAEGLRFGDEDEDRGAPILETDCEVGRIGFGAVDNGFL